MENREPRTENEEPANWQLRSFPFAGFPFAVLDSLFSIFFAGVRGGHGV